MEYYLKSGQTSGDILFWMADLTRTKFPKSVLSIQEEERERELFTAGLEDAMYARLCPFNESFDVSLSMDNGDALIYEAAYPRVLNVVGMDGFVKRIMELPPPKHHTQFTYGDFWTNAQFQMCSEFVSQSSADCLRNCLSVAKEVGMNMYVSAVENNGRAIAVNSMSMLLGYKGLIDIIVKDNNDKWILMHFPTGMVYSSGIKLSTVVKLLNNIIITT